MCRCSQATAELVTFPTLKCSTLASNSLRSKLCGIIRRHLWSHRQTRISCTSSANRWPRTNTHSSRCSPQPMRRCSSSLFISSNNRLAPARQWDRTSRSRLMPPNHNYRLSPPHKTSSLPSIVEMAISTRWHPMSSTGSTHKGRRHTRSCLEPPKSQDSTDMALLASQISKNRFQA